MPNRTNPSKSRDLADSKNPTNSEPSVKFLNVTQNGPQVSDTPYFKVCSPNAANHTKMSRSNMTVTSHKSSLKNGVSENGYEWPNFM